MASDRNAFFLPAVAGDIRPEDAEREEQCGTMVDDHMVAVEVQAVVEVAVVMSGAVDMM